jgi:hypothetical protein
LQAGRLAVVPVVALTTVGLAGMGLPWLDDLGTQASVPETYG